MGDPITSSAVKGPTITVVDSNKNGQMDDNETIVIRDGGKTYTTTKDEFYQNAAYSRYRGIVASGQVIYFDPSKKSGTAKQAAPTTAKPSTPSGGKSEIKGTTTGGGTKSANSAAVKTYDGGHRMTEEEKKIDQENKNFKNQRGAITSILSRSSAPKGTYQISVDGNRKVRVSHSDASVKMPDRELKELTATIQSHVDQTLKADGRTRSLTIVM